MAKYKVRWKGKEIGEFSKAEIESNLRSSKMGLLHQVFAGDKWVNLSFFIKEYEEEVLVEEKPQGTFITSLTYFSTGFAFISPYLILITLMLAMYLFLKESKKNAIWVLCLAILMMSLGIVFFDYVSTLKA